MRYETNIIYKMESDVLLLISKGREDLSPRAIEIKESTRLGSWFIMLGVLVAFVGLIMAFSDYEGTSGIMMAMGGGAWAIGGVLFKQFAFWRLEALHKSEFPEDPIHDSE